MKDSIRAYIVEQILEEDTTPPDLADDTPLLSSGLLDSLAVEQLLLFLEDEHGVKFEESDYSVENFETIAAIHGLLRRKIADLPTERAPEDPLTVFRSPRSRRGRHDRVAPAGALTGDREDGPPSAGSGRTEGGASDAPAPPSRAARVP